MKNVYTEVANRKVTPQNEKAKAGQVVNNAGGFVFKVDLWDRVRRFLILGSDKGTFYVNARKLTKDNAAVISEAVKADTRRLVDTIVEVSDKALAAKNSPALFALAIALTEADAKDKEYVRNAVNKVARTGTHLFEFAEYVENLGGWGRSKRKALAGWYENKRPESLAYQAVKYRQRNGWTHRDVLRLAHPKVGKDSVGVVNFMLGKDFREGPVIRILPGFEAMQKAQSVKDVVRILNEYSDLPWEAIPTQFLREPEVWKTLFYFDALGQTALLRNVTRFAEIGAFDDLKFAGDVAKRLTDEEAIRKGRMHPVAYLNALGVYRDGKKARGGYSYGYAEATKHKTNPKILGALEAGFYTAFGNVVPADKRTMIGLDVSGSMTWDAPAGLVGVDCMQAALAMAMVTVRTEPYVMVGAFDNRFSEVNISDRDTLKSAMQKLPRNFGGTDCALPMVEATRRKLEIDTFVVYTDNETWAGRVHPFQALRQYRDKMGIPARLVVVGMTATDFTIADPSDKGMLDVVGFDASAPGVISNFSAGR